MSTNSSTCYLPGAVGLPLQANFTCAPHFYCPNSTDLNSLPTYCPPTPTCTVLRLAGITCDPQSSLEPLMCMEGYYCPDQYTKRPCPSGYYCPTGSLAPRPCKLMSSCPQGTSAPLYYGGLVICGVLDAVLVIVMLSFRYMHRRRAARGAVEEPMLLTKMFMEEDIEVGQQATKANAQLVRAFQRAMDGSKLFMNFRFEALGLCLSKGKKTILDGVTGSIQAGRITAIMGPSGAGKTTFMNVLMGKVLRTDGTLYINGRTAEVHQYRKLIGYVPQEDVMMRELTVRENILHAARIKLPADWTDREVTEYVDAVIAALHLSHVAHTVVGDEMLRGISGGQRKRVNIGLELAGVPLTLFLDEPTSGLDSTSALLVCSALKDLSQLGLTIVSVIHQPRYEIFGAFEDVILLVPGGKVAYMGPALDAQPYFEALGFEFNGMANPADLLMDILAGSGINRQQVITSDRLAALWETHVASRDQSAMKTEDGGAFYRQAPSMVAKRGAPWYRQAWHCHNRSILQQLRLLSSLWLELVVAIVAGSLMGISINGEQLFTGAYVAPYTLLSPAPRFWLLPLSGLLIGIIIALAGAPAGVKVFSEEKAVYWREAASGHNVFSYYMGKTTVATYRLVLSALHFAAVYALLAKPQSSFERQFVIILLEFFGVYGLSAMVSMLVQRQNASIMAVVSCLLAAILCGFGPTLWQAKSWGVMFIWELSFNKWGAEALYWEGVGQFDGVYDIQSVANNQGYTLDRFWFDAGMMAVLGCAFRVIALGLMLVTHRDRQR
ncbi:hypothetical protein RI367_005860 [Sorochytrium milnesiophthora]